jgi:hypothetical protein
MNIVSPIFILILCFGCKSLDKKIVRDSTLVTKQSKAQPEIVVRPPSATITRLPVDINLQWDSVNGGVAYNIFYGVESNDWSSLVHLGNVTNCTVSGLSGGLTYYFRASVENEEGVASDLSDVVTASKPMTLQIHLGENFAGGHLEKSPDMFHWQDCPSGQTNGDWYVVKDASEPILFYRSTSSMP